MPELPEIFLLKKYIDATSLNKKIMALEFLQTSLLQAPKEEFEKLKGRSFKSSRQLGKYLFLEAEKDLWLGFHFGMTGKLEYYQHPEPPKYSHLVFRFEDDSRLAYVCRRKLGKIYLTTGVEDFQKKNSLGKHALEVSSPEFKDILDKKKGMIKALLTDQHEISGIGNVYADEMLFQAGIHPKTPTDKLSTKEIQQLYSKMKMVLTTAIEKEGERSEFPASFLSPHRKEGADCPNCKGKVEKTTVAGRSTYFCPSCQQLRS